MSDGVQQRTTAALAEIERTSVGQDVRGLGFLNEILETRVPWLFASPRGRKLLPLVHRMVNHRNAARMMQQWSRCPSGIEVIRQMHQTVRPRVSVRGLEHVPAQGGCLLISNHPTGLTDGVALFDPVRHVRQDVAIFVFHDLLSINPQATDALIPVEWRPSHQSTAKSRETLRIAHRAFKSNRLVTIFPSGRMSYWNGRRIAERPWRDSFILLARRYGLPVIPAHIGARNSLTYYGLSQVCATLRDLQSINEIQNKTGHRFDVTFGEPLLPDQLDGDADQLAGRIQRYVERILPRRPEIGLSDWLHNDTRP